jgi:hypothetical protein
VDIEMAVDADGTVTGMRAAITAAVGPTRRFRDRAWWRAGRCSGSAGAYRVKNYAATLRVSG